MEERMKETRILEDWTSMRRINTTLGRLVDELFCKNQKKLIDRLVHDTLIPGGYCETISCILKYNGISCLQINLDVQIPQKLNGIIARLIKENKLKPSVEIFQYASENGLEEVINHFLDEYPDFDPAYNYSASIKIASCNGHVNVVSRLLKDGRINPAVGPFNKAIVEAARWCRIDVVALLLKDGRVDPSVEYQSAIQSAMKFMNPTLTKLLLSDKRVDPTFNKDEFLVKCMKEDNLEMATLLLRHKRVDPATRDNQILIDACRRGSYNSVSFILGLGYWKVNPSARENCAIREAALGGNEQIIELLLKDQRVDPTERSYEALKNAQKMGYFNILDMLLEHPKVISKLGGNSFEQTISPYDQDQ